jgi:DNA mismatch repair protein MutS2
MGGQGGALGQALRSLEEERARLEVARRGAEADRAQAKAAEERARAAEEAGRKAEREAAARMGEALADDLDSARAEVAELLAELQAKPSLKAAAEAQKKLDAWRATVAGAAKAAQAKADAGSEAVPDGEVRAGVRVRVLSLGQEGEVVEVEGGNAVVRAGPLKIRRPVADLLPLRGKAKDASLGKSRSEKLAAAAEARPDAPRSPERRLDVRGLRVEELLREVERFLDQRYAEGEAECLILHGHGTGALKQALRDHLSASPYVGDFRAGDRHEGGDAVTVVSFRR